MRLFIGGSDDLEPAGGGSGSAIGTEPGAMLDAILLLGLWAFESSGLGDIGDIPEEEFTQYLQVRFSLPPSSLLQRAHQTDTFPPDSLCYLCSNALTDPPLLRSLSLLFHPSRPPLCPGQTGFHPRHARPLSL